MTDVNPARLVDAVMEALDLTGADRAAYLERLRADDPRLAYEVARLVARHEADKGSSLQPPEQFDASVGAETLRASHPPPSLIEGPGTQLGPYRLLQQIGEGGFGMVFLAEQLRPVRRKVAIKIIKLGMDTQQVIARFEAERQALAMMDHANIARVLDAGSTQTGRPYFVMELVTGDPITSYCDKHNLSVVERLEIFEQVCRAVQHAHQKGIIHRDIKPSNILVGEQDGKPFAKIIDFGIAKATGGRLTDRTVFTEHRALIGTPEYMSPEQAEGSLDIDTRTDVYSLGVLLYELLTGSTPFTSETLRGAVHAEIERIIREVEPPKPSTRLTQTPGLSGVAAHRRTEPKRLSTLVRGELDCIVMKAMDKERSRRYDVASGLAEDVRRYLAGERVEASPASRSYRLRKFVRRNRGLVAAALAVVLTLILGIVGTAYQARIAGIQRDLAVEAGKREADQRGIAEASAAAEVQARRRAEAIGEFVVTSLTRSDPVAGGRQDATILEAMEGARKDIERGRFKDDPQTEAELKYTIAVILQNNGRTADAEPLARESLEIRQRLFPGDHPDVAKSLSTLGIVREDMGRVAEAKAYYQRSLDMRRRLFSGDHEDIASSLNNLAAAYKGLNRHAEAEKLFREALDMRRRLVTGDHPEVATGMANLATTWLQLGRAKEAEPMLREVLDMRKRLYGEDHPYVASTLNSLAGAMNDLGHPEEAETYFVKAMDMHRRLFKGDHPEVATACFNVAIVRQVLGRSRDAEAPLRESLEMRRRLYKGDHASVATSLSGLAVVLGSLGRAAEGEPLLVEALDMYRRLFPGDSVQVAGRLSNLGFARLELARPAEAEPLFVEALEMHGRLVGNDSADRVGILIGLGRTRQAMGAKSQARESFDEAIAIQRRLTPGGSLPLANALSRSAQARIENGDHAGAIPELEEAIAIGEKRLPSDHRQMVIFREALARCLEAAGK